MKTTYTISLLSLVAASAMAQDAPPLGSPFYDQQTFVYVDSPINDVTELAGKLTCMLDKAGFNMPELVNSTWRSVQPESECFDGDWTGNVTAIFDSQRLSNSTPRELIGWVTLETPGAYGNYVMTLTQTEGADLAPPFGLFEMKFYMATGNEDEVPGVPLDTALIKTEKTPEGVKLTTLRNQRYNGRVQKAVVHFRNGGSDVMVSAASNGEEMTGVGNGTLFRSSTPEGNGASCKARDVKYQNVWENRLFTSSGQPIILENANLNVRVLEDESDEIVGNAGISPNNHWFDVDPLPTPGDNIVRTKDVSTHERIDLVWTPGELKRQTPTAYVIQEGDVFQFYNHMKAKYDGIGFAYLDQSIPDENVLPWDVITKQDTGIKYVFVDETMGQGTWHPSLDKGIKFYRSENSEKWSVNTNAILEFDQAIDTKDPLLVSNVPTPMVCVSDFRCPHIINVAETGFGFVNEERYQVNGKFDLQPDTTKFDELFFPRTLDNTISRTFTDHHYLVTPLDVSNTEHFPPGTLPASVYYDLDKDGVLSTDDYPMITLLNRSEGNGWRYNDRELAASEIANLSNFSINIPMVTKQQWLDGCDNKSYDSDGNWIDSDTSFDQCVGKVLYKTETRANNGRYYPRNNSGNFIYQEKPIAVTYTTNQNEDLNVGFNDRVEDLLGETNRIKLTYTTNSENWPYNSITGEKCLDRNNGCTEEIGPEAIHGVDKLFVHDGREFYPLPGDEFLFPGEDPEDARFYPSMNLESGTKVYDLLDASKYYFVKNIGVSHTLIEVDDAICAANGLNYVSESDPAFNGFRQGDIPNENIDSLLQQMSTWGKRLAAADSATTLGCYVNNGVLRGSCNFE